MSGATDRDTEATAEELRGLRADIAAERAARERRARVRNRTVGWLLVVVLAVGVVGYVKHKKDAERRGRDREVGCLAARFGDEPLPDGC